MTRKPIIGLIGGIGGGKSFVAALLVARGGFLIGGDPLGHEGLRESTIKAEVLAEFGSDLKKPDGEIDRRKLGAIVFNDPTRLRRLEAIVFPYIGRRVHDEIAKAQVSGPARFIILDAAVLVEAGWKPMCDHVLFVDADRAVRLERVRRTRGWTDVELAVREASQLPLDEKRKAADAMLDNSGAAAETTERLDAILRKWKLLPQSTTKR